MMKNPSRTGAVVMAGFCLAVSLGSAASTQTHPPDPSAVKEKEEEVTRRAQEEKEEEERARRATGTFEVKLTPEATAGKAEDAPLGRMSIDKQFHGDLEATSKGEMLTAGISVKGSGGYVAIERVSGTLHGRSGTFVLQHSGTMTRGAQQLRITVVPDSGTGQLAGLAGKMAITIADGKHSYEFVYTLAEAPEHER